MNEVDTVAINLEWLVENLRVTAFTKEPLNITERHWHAVTGQDEAETRTQIPGGRVYSGPAVGGHLLLSSSGTRLDCLLSPSMERRGDVQSVGPWPKASEHFVECTERLLVDLGTPISRLAFGAVLLSKEENLEAAYDRLKGLLTSLNVRSEMRDLLFRVNWPRASTVISGLNINRMTSWSVVRISQAMLVVGPGGLPHMQPGVELTGHFVRLEIDNNTAADWKTPFESSEIGAIYKELVSLTDENTRRGEVP